MNIGIITFHRAENYGSALQAYALNRFLRSNRSEDIVETIDYQNISQYRIYRLFRPVRSIMDAARNFHSLLYARSLKKRKRRFHQFIDEFLTLSEYHGRDVKRLADYSRKYDVVICGSDQIWNVRCWDYDPCYMLSFVEQSRKIAYAPSLGLSIFTPKEEQSFLHYLPSFAALSIREQEGAYYLTRMLGREAVTVADPVFLLDAEHWRNIKEKTSIQGKYILCYFIGDISGMRAFAKRVQRETGITRIVIIIKNLRDIFSGYTTKFDTGPREFVGLVDGAEYIVTDSFHAVAFSLLLHKKFWVFVESGDAASAKPNSRIRNILEKTGLQHRMLDVDTCRECDTSSPIDFRQSDIALKQYIEESLIFLNEKLYGKK